jgi:hypothetical protein
MPETQPLKQIKGIRRIPVGPCWKAGTVLGIALTPSRRGAKPLDWTAAREFESPSSGQRAWIRQRDEAVKDALSFAKTRPETPDDEILKIWVMHGSTESRTELPKWWGL